jgi:hypothetical protein
MDEFAKGFSEKLRQIATENRPVGFELNFEQIQKLASLAGYRIKGNGRHNFLLYSTEGGGEDILFQSGIDSGILIKWSVVTDRTILIYHPVVEPRLPKGRLNPPPTMIDRLSSLLIHLGLKEEIVIHLKERTIIVPDSLKDPENPIDLMFYSEFEEKYEKIYHQIKNVLG